MWNEKGRGQGICYIAQESSKGLGHLAVGYLQVKVFCLSLSRLSESSLTLTGSCVAHLVLNECKADSAGHL